MLFGDYTSFELGSALRNAELILAVLLRDYPEVDAYREYFDSTEFIRAEVARYTADWPENVWLKQIIPLLELKDSELQNPPRVLVYRSGVGHLAGYLATEVWPVLEVFYFEDRSRIRALSEHRFATCGVNCRLWGAKPYKMDIAITDNVLQQSESPIRILRFLDGILEVGGLQVHIIDDTTSAIHRGVDVDSILKLMGYEKISPIAWRKLEAQIEDTEAQTL